MRTETARLFRERFVGSSILNPVIPNVKPDSNHQEFCYMQLIDPVREDIHVNPGQQVKDTGSYSFTVVRQAGLGEDEANTEADAVAELFKMGTKMIGTGVSVIVKTPPSIRAGYPDGEDWRVPVIVRFEASKLG